MFTNKVDSIKEKTQIIVLPEMFSTGFTMRPEVFAETMNGETVGWLRKTAIAKRVILTGSIIIHENDEYYNRLIWMLPNGEHTYYDKRHLFAYGNEHLHFNAGNKRLIAAVKGWKINLQVCYDLRFPVWARQSPLPPREGKGLHFEYDLLIYVANWPQSRIHAWKTLLRARAIENQCYVAGVNRVGYDGNGIYYSGDSTIIDPLGEILYGKESEEDVFTYTFEKEKLNAVREKFPFWQDADLFNITGSQ